MIHFLDFDMKKKRISVYDDVEKTITILDHAEPIALKTDFHTGDPTHLAIPETAIIFRGNVQSICSETVTKLDLDKRLCVTGTNFRSVVTPVKVKVRRKNIRGRRK